jgi:hypothetical protein
MSENFVINASNIVIDDNGNYVIMLSPTKNSNLSQSQELSQESQPSECQQKDKLVQDAAMKEPNLLSQEQKSNTVIWSQKRDRNQKEIDNIATEAFLGIKFYRNSPCVKPN